MRRDLRVVLNAFSEYQIGFGNQFHISSMDGYNIKSSAFLVSGISQPVYLSDIPNTNGETGNIFFFTVPSANSTSATILRRNVGSIDYKRGIITLNPISVIGGKLKDGQTIIEISAIPHSNDVVGLQDLYLQLDINNSTFDMVTDNIASGLDPSASNYISSSSYANGALVRPTPTITSGGTTISTTNVNPTNTAGTTATTTTSAPSASSGTSFGSTY
jgi:hypothetical protein